MKSLTWNIYQKKFLLDKDNNIASFGGYRLGKSVVTLFKIIQICRFMPGSKALVGRKNYTGLRADTFEILFNSQTGLLNGLGVFNKTDKVFNFYNGSLIFFKHFDDVNALKGPTTSIIFLEQTEEIKKEVFDVLKTRNSLWGNPDNPDSEYNKYIQKYGKSDKFIQRPDHFMFITANPYPCWLKDYFIDVKPEGWKIYNESTRVNEKNLPAGYIEEQKMQMSDQEFNQYIEGSWQFAQGRIYSEFNPARHILDSPVDIKKLIKPKIVCAIDPGYQHHTGVVWAAIMPDGRIIIYDEVYEKEKTTDEIAEIINIKMVHHGVRPELFLIDYAANTHSRTDGRTEADIFKAHKIPVQNADKEVFAGIMKTKSLFKQDKIEISPICNNIIKELGLYSWDPKRPDQPIKSNDDLLDPLRYIVNKWIKGYKLDPVPVKLSGQTLQSLFIKSMFEEPKRQTNDSINYGL